MLLVCREKRRMNSGVSRLKSIRRTVRSRLEQRDVGCLSTMIITRAGKNFAQSPICSGNFCFWPIFSACWGGASDGRASDTASVFLGIAGVSNPYFFTMPSGSTTVPKSSFST